MFGEILRDIRATKEEINSARREEQKKRREIERETEAQISAVRESAGERMKQIEKDFAERKVIIDEGFKAINDDNLSNEERKAILDGVLKQLGYPTVQERKSFF